MTGAAVHSSHSEAAFHALPHPILCVGRDGCILEANAAAEDFFAASAVVMRRHHLLELVPFGSPLITLVDQVRDRATPMSEYRVDLGLPRNGTGRLVDIQAAPLPDWGGGVVVILQERTIADKMDRQLTHRSAARSVTALASMLAHEIKNPLAGIRGAAQLLEQSSDDQDRALTQLICDEADRIVRLVDRMEIFSDERPVVHKAVNVHVVLGHVKKLAQSSFGRAIRFVEDYDPSLPPAQANQDQLVQVVLNLVKNAAEALQFTPNPEIHLTTGFRTGVKLAVAGSSERMSLPLEICVRDNGPGVPADLMPHLFAPFVTTKPEGSGLGLALVAKIIGDHGGVVECESRPQGTLFRILLPMFRGIEK